MTNCVKAGVDKKRWLGMSVAGLLLAGIPNFSHADPTADNWACDRPDPKFALLTIRPEVRYGVYAIDEVLAQTIDKEEAAKLLEPLKSYDPYKGVGPPTYAWASEHLAVFADGVALGGPAAPPEKLEPFNQYAFHVLAGFSIDPKQDARLIQLGRAHEIGISGHINLWLEKISSKGEPCQKAKISENFKNKSDGIQKLEGVMNFAYALARLGAKPLSAEVLATRFKLGRQKYVRRQTKVAQHRKDPKALARLQEIEVSYKPIPVIPFVAGTLPGLATPEETEAYEKPK